MRQRERDLGPGAGAEMSGSRIVARGGLYGTRSYSCRGHRAVHLWQGRCHSATGRFARLLARFPPRTAHSPLAVHFVQLRPAILDTAGSRRLLACGASGYGADKYLGDGLILGDHSYCRLFSTALLGMTHVPTFSIRAHAQDPARPLSRTGQQPLWPLCRKHVDSGRFSSAATRRARATLCAKRPSVVIALRYKGNRMSIPTKHRA